MSQFRVALVGLGSAGFGLHLPALAGISAATVVGACDPDRARRQRAAVRWRVPVFEDFDDMLRRAQPDTVVVGTPPDSHADYCLRSLAAGAHVICEKPFVSSPAEADLVISAAAAAGRHVALNHQFREMPIFRAVREAVHASSSGEVRFAQVWQLMDLPPWEEHGWRGRLVQRSLYEAGVHLVDLLLVLFGEQPISVMATVSDGGAGGEQADAVVVVTLEFSRGRLAQVVQNRLCKGQTQYFEVRADTADASLRASFGGRARLTAGLYRSTRPRLRLDFGMSGLAWKEIGHRRVLLARNPKDPMVVATRYILGETLAAFHAGTAPPVTAEHGRCLLEVIAACYQSAATGRRISLNGRAAQHQLDMRTGATAGT